MNPRPPPVNMRATVQKIVLFTITTLLGATPLAWAKNHKTAATSHTHSAPKAKRPAAKPEKANKTHSTNNERTRASLSRARSQGKQSRPSSRTIAHSGRHASSRSARAATAASKSERAAQPEIHVTHDRKQHHTAPVAQAAIKSQKATPKDFLWSKMPPTHDLSPTKLHPRSSPAPKTEESTPAEISLPAEASADPALSIARPLADKLLPSIEDEVVTPVLLPSLYDKRGHLLMPPALKGSHEILLHQNLMADHDGLLRVQDDDDLVRMRTTHLLVPILAGDGMVLDGRLPANRRFVRPWVAEFLVELAHAHYARFHTPLQVNSAVRTVEFQQHLIHVNGNAAPAAGETASPHLTGQAIDLAKHRLSAPEIAWMRSYLLPLVQAGRIDVEEEFQQACFHISVYRRYLGPEPAYAGLPIIHRGSGSALALALR